jgi:hypothetical protein
VEFVSMLRWFIAEEETIFWLPFYNKISDLVGAQFA